MSKNQTLSVPFADLGSMGGAFRAILKKALQSVDGMLPATVVAADAKREYATVQPLIMVLGTDGSTTSRAQIAKVPIFNAGAGGFVMSFPIKPGDLGWIVASDRDISLYLQANAEAKPNTLRLHSFEDGLFIPDAARRWALSDDDATAAVWQSLDGTIKISLDAGKITVLHPTLVEVHCPLVHAIGGDVKADDISLKTHTHSDVTTGSGNTGPPQP